ncbi:hypothetical protein PV11_03500 [Exophiala sideris]|uniref:Alpha/beta hydrolase fold-3 domain-containing protein n=1 Tax=Exophiala sideris TaxID=1016849 RepID=A0A0D1YEC3_9EURO|nr:hypothetical protein PV11_03500 [Exophiala sideris]
MAEVNWDRVREQPLLFSGALLATCYQVVKYGVSRLIAMRHPHRSSFEMVARNILCNTLMSFNHLFILDAPAHSTEMACQLRGQGFEAFATHSKPSLKDSDLVIFFCHGGGYGAGHPLQYRTMYQRWKNAAADFGFSLEVVALKYPLTPEHPYPAALNSARAAYSYLINDCELDCRRICFAGDSAGGNLVAACLVDIRDKADLPIPGGAVLLSPWLDLTLSLSQKSPDRNVDVMVSPEMMASYLVPAFTGGKYEAEDPRISPVLGANLEGLPPTFVSYGDAEVLQMDAMLWIQRCREAGVSVTTFIGHGGLHAFGVGGMICTANLEKRSDQALMRFLLKQNPADISSNLAESRSERIDLSS